METYRELLASVTSPATSTRLVSSTTALPTPGGCVGGGIEPSTEDWSLPGPRPLLTLEVACQPPHDYPVWDWLIPENTPIFNVHTGPSSRSEPGRTTGGPMAAAQPAAAAATPAV